MGEKTGSDGACPDAAEHRDLLHRQADVDVQRSQQVVRQRQRRIALPGAGVSPAVWTGQLHLMA